MCSGQRTTCGSLSLCHVRFTLGLSSPSIAANSFTFWATLHVPSQLAIPKEASRVSLLESDMFRQHGGLAGLGVSGQTVYSHLLSQAERQCILTILLRGTELRDCWGFNSQIAEITYACSVLLTFGLETGISKISALGTH